MIVDHYEPVNLFALVPQLGTGFDARLRELDQLLDDDVIFQRVKADLVTAHPQSARKGRHSTPVEVILRMRRQMLALQANMAEMETRLNGNARRRSARLASWRSAELDALWEELMDR